MEAPPLARERFARVRLRKGQVVADDGEPSVGERRDRAST